MTKKNVHTAGTDDWLTPPEVIDCLGPFDTDPCCHATMPWQTAKAMYTKEDDGLARPWHGRVWLNPPYSKVTPWARCFADHNNGISLTSAKSLDTVWAHLLLEGADLIFILKGRFSFYYPNGLASEGKWLSSVFTARGEENAEALLRLRTELGLPGRFYREVHI